MHEARLQFAPGVVDSRTPVPPWPPGCFSWRAGSHHRRLADLHAVGANTWTDLGADGLLDVQSHTPGRGLLPRAGLGWKVLLRQPEATAMAGFHAPEVRILWAALALCELLTPLLWQQARRLAAPLRELATHRPGP